MGMLACSVVAVVVAYAAERDNDDTPLPAPSEPPQPAARRDLVWAAMGASDGTGDGTPHPERDNWVAQLAATLPPDVAVYNFAVSGSTLGEARVEQLPAILASHP